MHSPNFLVFTVGKELRFGFSKRVIDAMMASRMKDFLVYEEGGSTECARCLGSDVGVIHWTLPLYHVLWSPTTLNYVISSIDEAIRFTGMYCQECDTWLREMRGVQEESDESESWMETCQAVIQFDGSIEYARVPIALDLLGIDRGNAC